jgi:hypothetical protein
MNIKEDLQKIKRANPFGVSRRVLVERGLAAGDRSRPYVTDKGDDYLANPEMVELKEALEKL